MKGQIYNTTTTNMKDVVSELPIGYEYPIFDGKGDPITNFKLVQTEYYINKNKANNTNDGMRIFTDKYNLVQHSFVADYIASVLQDMNLKGGVKIEVSEDGSKMNGYVFFDDKIIKDDATGIKVGFKFTNSYDGSGSISFSSYGVRLVCSNQMVLSNLCTREVITHYGSKDFELKMKDAIELVVAQDDNFQRIINQAMTDVFEIEQLHKLFNEFITKWFGHKRTSEILKAIGFSIIKVEEDEKTKYSFVAEANASLKKWDLYNAITSHLSHSETVSLQAKDWMQKAAEKVLMIKTR
jgi:hypothetical protein